jgi:hypothetical protein
MMTTASTKDDVRGVFLILAALIALLNGLLLYWLSKVDTSIEDLRKSQITYEFRISKELLEDRREINQILREIATSQASHEARLRSLEKGQR